MLTVEAKNEEVMERLMENVLNKTQMTKHLEKRKTLLHEIGMCLPIS